MQPGESQAGDHQRAIKLRELRRLLRQTPVIPKPTRDGVTPLTWEHLVGEVGPKRLIDCLATPGSGASLVALKLCSRACLQRGELVVVDPMATFFPPTAVAWGVDAERLIVVSPPTEAEAIAVVEVALRSLAVASVWALLGKIDDRAFRRLLLASEAGRAFGALVRPALHESQPSWGDVQLRFDAVSGVTLGEGKLDEPFLVRVTQTRNRHGPAGGEAMLAIDWDTGKIEELALEQHAEERPQDAMRLAAELARTTRSA